jgi:DoxX-like family
MSASAESAGTPKGMLWTGRVISGLVVLFMLFDCIAKIVKEHHSVDATVKMGFAASAVAPIGVTLLICVILYVIPRTSILGAILIVGYLGGAVATNVRAGSPVFNSAFAITFGLLTWLGLYVRDSRLQALVPFKR